MKLKLLFAAAVAFTAFPAQAQDTGNGTFTGPRIQVQGGWDRAGINLRDTRNFGGRGDFGGASDQDNELTYGGEVGFDFDLGGIVIGAYAGVNFSDSAEGFDFNTATPPQPRVLLEAERDMYLGGRVGFAAGDRVLVYGKGGLSRGTLEASNPNGTPTLVYPNNEDEFDGWHIGGGVEVAVTEMVYVRADYTHTSYDDLALPAQANPAQTLELHFNRNQITAGIGVRF